MAHGCAISGAPSAMPDGAAPADLTIDVRVDGASDGRWGGHRYVLFPDGALHHEITDAPEMERLPVLRRILDRGQTRDVWRLASAAVEADAGEPPPAAAGSPVMDLTIGADGRWGRHRISLGPAGPPAAAALLDRLAGLAWAGEARSEAIIAPKRYDLGPDPYARYRR